MVYATSSTSPDRRIGMKRIRYEARPRRTAQWSAAEVVGVWNTRREIRTMPRYSRIRLVFSILPHHLAALKLGSGGFFQLLRRRTPKIR